MCLLADDVKCLLASAAPTQSLAREFHPTTECRSSLVACLRASSESADGTGLGGDCGEANKRRSGLVAAAPAWAAETSVCLDANPSGRPRRRVLRCATMSALECVQGVGVRKPPASPPPLR